MCMAVHTLSRKELLHEIEVVRTKMHFLSEKMMRTSDEVVKTSAYLDQLLNQYQSLQIHER